MKNEERPAKPKLVNFLTLCALTVAAVFVAAITVAELSAQSYEYTVYTTESGMLEVCPVEGGLNDCKNVKESIFQSAFRQCVDRGAHETREYTRIIACDEDVLNGGM